MHTQQHHSLQHFSTVKRNIFKLSWFRFLIYSLIILSLGGLFLYYFHIYFLLIFSVIFVFFWTLVRRLHLKKLQDLVAIRIPDYIWQAFYQRHPQMSESSQEIIEEGFKDYLALHLWSKNSYAMPSHAVDALWHVLIEEFQDFYDLMCKNTLGYELRHKPHDKNPTTKQKEEQRKQLINTWQAACQIHHLDPKNTQTLPRLFQIDTQVKWENGIHFQLPVLLAMYGQLLDTRSDTSPSHPNSACSSTTAFSSSSCSGSSSDVSHSHSGYDANSDGDSSSDSSCSSCGGGGD